jgi:protocatechuate 3,4-dioxygenase beta subunit
MLKIFISLTLTTILFLGNSKESLANQEEILEIEIPITKNEDSKITNKNIPLVNKKKFILNSKKSLDKNLNLQKTTNLLNNNKKNDADSGKINVLGTVKKSINLEKNKQELVAKKTVQNLQDKENSIVTNRIINSKQDQSNIKSDQDKESPQKSLESKQMLEPIADVEIIEDDKISKLRQKKLQQESFDTTKLNIEEQLKKDKSQNKTPQNQLKNIFQEPSQREDEKNSTEENKTESSNDAKSKLSPFKPKKPTPARFFSADLSAPETFFSSNNLIKKTGSFYRGFGEIIFFKGTITDSFGVPISNAIIEIWQANSAGKYHSLLEPNSEYIDPYFNMSGKAITNNVGEYNFITIMPGSKVGRAPHININVYHPKFGKLETESYFENHPNNKNDYQYTSYDKIDADLLTAKVSYSEPNNPKSVKICTFNIVLQGTHQYKKY